MAIFNPFSYPPPFVDFEKDLIGREELLKNFKSRISHKGSVGSFALIGVKGMGKSSLLNCLFSSAAKIELAREYHHIVYKSTFPINLKGDMLYTFFIDNIISALSEIKNDIGSKLYDSIKAHIDAKRGEHTNACSLLENILKMLSENFGYKVIMVLDNFQDFCCSPYVTSDQHSVMHSLLNYMTYVVATDYDFLQTTMTAEGAGSYLIHSFENNENIKGLGEDETMEYIRCMLEDNKDFFTDEEMRVIYTKSSGIPTIINRVSDIYFDFKAKNGCIDYDTADRKIMDKCKNLFSHWCNALTHKHLYTLKRVSEQECVSPAKFSNMAVKQALVELYNRGIVEENISTVSGYTLNPIFRMYVREFVTDEREQEEKKPDNPDIISINSFLETLKNVFTANSENVPSVITNMSNLDNDAAVEHYSEGILDIIGPDSEITPDEYNFIHLQPSDMKMMSESSLNLLKSGIRTARVVNLLSYRPYVIDTNYGAYCLYFSQLYENHLHDCFYSLLQNWTDEKENILNLYLSTSNYRNIKYLPSADHINNFYYEKFITAFATKLADACKQFGMEECTQQWWIALETQMETMRGLRNYVHPEKGIMTYELAHKLIYGLFSKDEVIKKISVAKKLSLCFNNK